MTSAAVMRRAVDPAAQLASLFDLLDQARRSTAANLRKNERNRLNMLFVHAVAAVVIAPTFYVSLRTPGYLDQPSWVLLRPYHDGPLLLAMLLGFGGAILLPATLLRSLPWEMLGLAMILAWYLCMAVILGGALVLWQIHGQPLDQRPGSYFGCQIYAHLSAVMTVHLITLVRLRMRQTRTAGPGL